MIGPEDGEKVCVLVHCAVDETMDATALHRSCSYMDSPSQPSYGKTSHRSLCPAAIVFFSMVSSASLGLRSLTFF